MANTGILKEYAMSVNDFKQPAEALGKKAIGVFLVRLLLLEINMVMIHKRRLLLLVFSKAKDFIKIRKTASYNMHM